MKSHPVATLDLEFYYLKAIRIYIYQENYKYMHFDDYQHLTATTTRHRLNPLITIETLIPPPPSKKPSYLFNDELDSPSCLIILEPYLLHTHDCEIYCKDDINKTTTTNSTTFHSILYDVILSILLDSKKLPKSWNGSMSSLGQLLAYDTAAKYIIVGCDINKSLSSNILFEFALQCFLTSPRLSLPHSPSSNNNNDNTNTTNALLIDVSFSKIFG